MLIQHNMTVVVIYDHETDYKEKTEWLRKNSGGLLIEGKYGLMTSLMPEDEKKFYEKFGDSTKLDYD